MSRACNAASSCTAPLDLWHRSHSLLFRGEIAGVIDAGYLAAAPFAIMTLSGRGARSTFGEPRFLDRCCERNPDGRRHHCAPLSAKSGWVTLKEIFPAPE
jgi:hypothetical protein